MELIGDIKTYEWGKFGEDSKVAQLAKLNQLNFEPISTQSYAELWMGDHPSGRSKLKNSGGCFSAYLDTNKLEFLGGMERLPFLLKVLSINKALSIQVHPNKKEAERLHLNRPDLYKDENHKPELAIALTPFLALCGFRPYDEIMMNMQSYPELIELIGNKNVQKLKTDKEKGLKECFHKLMTSNQQDIIKCISSLNEKFKSVEIKDKSIKEIFKTLNQDFPNDVGILCLFFLNIMELKPGQAIFLAANVPHAYLLGDCIECMACSDNVVRAGLTPKLKDVDTLIEMLNYEGQPGEQMIFQPIDCNYLKYTQHFIPKVKDFAVIKLEVPKIEKHCQIENRSYGSIMIILTGEATLKVLDSTIELKPGSIVFIPSNADKFLDLDIKPTNSDFLAYQAMYNNF